MRKSNFLFTSLIIASLSVFMACESFSQKMERAETPIMKSDRDVDMTESEVLTEVRKYRFKTANDIKANFRMIAAIQDSIDTKDEGLRENYEDKLEKLDNSNRGMKRSMDNFTESRSDRWIIFREVYSDSMDGLENSLDNFFAVISTNSKQ